MMNGASRFFKNAKRQAFLTVLEPMGFVRGLDLWVRRSGWMVHGLGFQADPRGAGYYVNVTVHPLGIPGLFRQRTAEIGQFELLDFLFSERLDKWVRADGTGIWTYPLTAAEAWDRVTSNINNALVVLTDFSSRWPTAESLLRRFSPELMRRDAEAAGRFLRGERDFKNDPLLGRLSPLDSLLGNGWSADGFELSVALALLADAEGKSDNAQLYLRAACEFPREHRTVARLDVAESLLTGKRQ